MTDKELSKIMSRVWDSNLARSAYTKKEWIDLAVAAARKPVCPTCRKHDELEEWGESGEFWWHCHRCEKDLPTVEEVEKAVQDALSPHVGDPWSKEVKGKMSKGIFAALNVPRGTEEES